MKPAFLAFTAKGEALARQLAAALGGDVMRCGAPQGLKEWTEVHFTTTEGLIYVGAAGIAVRAVAPHLQSKRTDPAVVAVDECARFVIPLVSGHWGGANDLARQIARICGAQAAITTATDANGLFAVDEWAKIQGCRLLRPEKGKEVSATILAGGAVRVRARWPIAGTPPPRVRQVDAGEYDVLLDIADDGREGLWLAPPIAVLGIGCKKGTSRETLEAALRVTLAIKKLPVEAIGGAASIDLKKDEPGLAEFCQYHGWPLQCYSAQALQRAAGRFTPSEFVQGVVGVDNVCERSAVLRAGGGLYQRKTVHNGVTMAVALQPYYPDWSWRNE